MAERRNRFLFETVPDLFPDPFLTVTEIELWSRFYKERNEEFNARRAQG